MSLSIDAADLRAREGVEIGALGQVLMDESVGVLVESALLGMVGGGLQELARYVSQRASWDEAWKRVAALFNYKGGGRQENNASEV